MKKVVRIENASPGAVIAQDVLDLRGSVLFKSGVELTEDMIHMMRLRNVTHLFIEQETSIRTPAATTPGANDEQIIADLNDAFVGAGDDPVLQKLREAAERFHRAHNS
jgi:hypothetical protein